MISDIVLIVITVIASAFFSGMEIAFVSANRMKLELAAQQGGLNGKILAALSKDQSRFIATMLIGNNVALVVFGIYMAKMLDPVFGEFISNEIGVLLLQTVVSTLIILTLAEFLPKAIFRIHANTLLSALALPVSIIYYLLYLVVTFVMFLSDVILKIFVKGKVEKEEQQVFGRVDLDHFVKEHTETQENKDEIETEIQIFQNALDFSKVKARECMLPRTDIVALPIDASLEELKAQFMETGLSKVLIYRENLDDIIGYVHSYEMFKKPNDVKSILIPIPVVTETMAGSDLLNFFIKERKSIALVVDEFGGTSGLVTMEDVIEEIFGEIEDEHDTPDLIEEQLSDGKFRFSARHEVDYLNEKYELNLPTSENYETLGGLIFAIHESIPEPGERIELDSYVAVIEKVEKNRIDIIKLQEKAAD